MMNFFHRAALAGLLLSSSACYLPATNAHAAISPTETTKLANGTTLLVRSDKIAPRVAISLLVQAGAADETEANAGWRQVLAAAILRATRLEAGSTAGTAPGAGATTGEAAPTKETVVRLADWQSQLENWGGEIGATVDDDSIEFWVTGNSAHTAELVRALTQIVLQPRLADEDLAAARRRVLALQNQAGNAISARAAQSIARQLYLDKNGKPLAYALPNFGSFDSLSGFTGEQLREWHAQYFVPSRFIIGASGDVSTALLKAELGSISAATTTGANNPAASQPPAGSTESTPVFGPIESGKPPLVVREMGAAGAWVFVAFRTPAPGAMSARENAAIEVLAAALEGSTLARLPRRLLGDADQPFNPNAKSNALAAQTASQWTTRRFAGELTVFSQTGPQNVEAVKNALLDEMRKLRDTPLSTAELQSARDFARGQWAVTRDALHERAFETALYALHTSSPDSKRPEHLQAVTAADVQQIAQKYLRDYSVVLIMPQE